MTTTQSRWWICRPLHFATCVNISVMKCWRGKCHISNHKPSRNYLQNKPYRFHQPHTRTWRGLLQTSSLSMLGTYWKCRFLGPTLAQAQH